MASGYNLSVFYADDTRWKPRPQWADPGKPAYNLQPWETYLDKADPSDFEIYQNLRPDVVFIVTPDFTHAALARWWLGKTPLVFVEKPFDSHFDNVEDLLRDLGRRRGTAILGLDHYQFYALPIHELIPAIVEHLGDALAHVVFYMTEDRPLELDRVRSLQYGLTLDMLPHCPALLTYFGDVGTIDDIQIVEVGQYRPLIAADRQRTVEADISQRFHNETASRVRFTFQDYSGNGYHVPCLAVVGKGLAQEVKYLEVTGRSGHAIRVDLNRPPHPNPVPHYPWDSVFFLQGEQAPLPPRMQVHEVQDPYDPQRTLRVLYDPEDSGRFRRPLERARYERLLDDLLNGTGIAVASTLLLMEASEIVRALDRIWWAIQASKPWTEYALRELHPIWTKETANTFHAWRAAVEQLPEVQETRPADLPAEHMRRDTVTEQVRTVRFVDKAKLRPVIAKAFEEMGIRGEPIGAEELQERMAAHGVKPEDNILSQGIIEMREE